MTDLFRPLRLGALELPNRVVMAPLTRARAVENAQPNALMARYYAQRASAGLIIAEATAVSEMGLGWLDSPGCFTDAHQAGWAQVADAVHAKGGRIVVQLWHMGRTVHPDFIGGKTPWSASDVPANGAMPTPAGTGEQPFVAPRAMTEAEIAIVIREFADAARRARAAGLDGVEIHAANGFLIDQFTRDGCNRRTDRWGGAVDNRLRFMMEVVQATCDAIGSDRVGIRLSPTNKVWGIADSDPATTFGRAAERLSDFDLAYLHVLEPKPDIGHFMECVDHLAPRLRERFSGSVILNGGFTRTSADAALAAGEAEAIAFGRPYIANPDLMERLRDGIPLAEPDRDTFYTGGARGYTDYPGSGA